MFDYLFFLLKSSNQHGVHSPYVFNYLTKGLYQKRKKYKKLDSKAERLVLSTIDYFSITKIKCVNEDVARKIERFFPKIGINEKLPYYDLIIVDSFSDSLPYFKKSNNETLIIILNPNRKRINKYLKSKEFTLVIDFYHVLFLHNRKEQLRQNFFLRY